MKKLAFIFLLLVFLIRSQTTAADDKKPIDVCKAYFVALAQLEKIDLDEILDWKSIQGEIAKENPVMKDLTVDAFSRIMKESFNEHPVKLDSETIRMIADQLQVVVKPKASGPIEEEVTVEMPGDKDVFKLKKINGMWKITHFPYSRR